MSEKVMKRRAAVEKWKAKNREYYLQQKRELSARPEYRAKVRARYRAQQDELKMLGILPRPPGRPRLYDAIEAIEMKRLRAREASARYRRKKLFSQLVEIDESTTNQNSESDRPSNY